MTYKTYILCVVKVNHFAHLSVYVAAYIAVCWKSFLIIWTRKLLLVQSPQSRRQWIT